jgi:hypothetical protein
MSHSWFISPETITLCTLLAHTLSFSTSCPILSLSRTIVSGSTCADTTLYSKNKCITVHIHKQQLIDAVVFLCLYTAPGHSFLEHIKLKYRIETTLKTLQQNWNKSKFVVDLCSYMPLLMQLVASSWTQNLGSDPRNGWEICGEQCDTGTGFPQSTFVFPCHLWFQK